MTDSHEALIYAMVLASAADSEMTDGELARIGHIVRTLPAFREFDEARLTGVAAACAEGLAGDKGLDAMIEEIRAALPPRLRETAYALACDVVAADLTASQEELRLLEFIRHRLEIDRLAAAAIERGVRARHATL